MKSDDITVHILTEIRDEIRTTNEKVDLLGNRVDLLGNRVGHLEDRVTEGDLRVSTELRAVHGTLVDVKNLLTDRLDLRDRVDRCERDIAALKKRSRS